ncbi:MAG: hypothetical protein M1838_001481 [Thelocarpon superellum]|nr:MAG: hypothetical protein M1838_001481 [Thelocarpon superellum]
MKTAITITVSALAALVPAVLADPTAFNLEIYEPTNHLGLDYAKVAAWNGSFFVGIAPSLDCGSLPDGPCDEYHATALEMGSNDTDPHSVHLAVKGPLTQTVYVKTDGFFGYSGPDPSNVLEAVPQGNGVSTTNFYYDPPTVGSSTGRFYFLGMDNLEWMLCPSDRLPNLYQVFANLPSLAPPGGIEQCFTVALATVADEAPQAWQYIGIQLE